MSLSAPAVSESLTEAQQQEQDVALVLQSALELHQAGSHQDALALYELIVEALPAHADARYGLAMLKVEMGVPAEALPHFEVALGTQPDNGLYWVNYISALFVDGQASAAWIAIGLAQKRGIKSAQLDWLIAQMAAPVALDLPVPKHAAMQDPAGREVASAVVAPADTNVARADKRRLDRHTALIQRGQYEEALDYARKLVADFPLDGYSHRALTFSLCRVSRHTEVIQAAHRTLELRPDDVVTRKMLAEGLREIGNLTESEAQARRVIEARPHEADGHWLLGSALYGQRRYEEAAAASRRAVELAPNNPIAHLNLGLALLDQGLAAEAIATLRRAVQFDTLDARNHSSILFRLSHSAAVDAGALLEEHRAYGRLHESHKTVKPHTNSREPERKLRIGLISGDLFNHAVTTYLAPVVKFLADDPGLSLHFYYNHNVEDDYTDYLRKHAESWTDTTGLNDVSLVARIRRDAIDILIDLSGHTDRNRLVALARKPAPIQVTWLGYPATTGLKAMDYFLADRYIAPPGLVDTDYVEKIVQIPAAGPYSAPLNSPPVNALPALLNGYITYGSFNRVNKLAPNVIALWATVLRADPTARMIVGAMERELDEQAILGWFAAEGIDADRISFRPRALVSVYLQQHHQVDICLDAFPYTGATTTINALWMGVPTLTISGRSVSTRGSLGWLSHVGLQQFIVNDPKDFAARAMEIAADVEGLRQLRASLRDRCISAPSIQPATLASGLAVALRSMWRRWCAGESPESFEAFPEPVPAE